MGEGIQTDVDLRTDFAAATLLHAEGDAHDNAAASDEKDSDIFANAGHLTFEMELDETKLMLNKIKRLLDTGMDADLIEAYYLVNDALQGSLYNSGSHLKSELDLAFEDIRVRLESKPEVRQDLNLKNGFTPSFMTPEPKPSQPQNNDDEYSLTQAPVPQISAPVQAPSIAPPAPSPFGGSGLA